MLSGPTSNRFWHWFPKWFHKKLCKFRKGIFRCRLMSHKPRFEIINSRFYNQILKWVLGLFIWNMPRVSSEVRKFLPGTHNHVHSHISFTFSRKWCQLARSFSFGWIAKWKSGVIDIVSFVLEKGLYDKNFYFSFNYFRFLRFFTL